MYGLVLGVAVPALLASRSAAQSTPITPGDLVIYQTVSGTATAGATGVSGSAAPSSAATQVYMDEYTPTGTFVQAIAVNSTVPTTTGAGTQYALTASGTAQSEGQISLSPDGQSVALTGYNAAVGTASVAGTATSAVSRTVGILNVSTGSIDTSTTLTTAYNTNNIRGAVISGTSIYTVGTSSSSTNSTAGLFYTTLGTAGKGTQIATDKDYGVQVYNGQLYVVDDTVGTNGVFAVPNTGPGGTLPTTATPPSSYTSVALANKQNGDTSTTNPEGFALLKLGSSTASNPDTVYLADSVDGLIEKFSYTGTGTTGSDGNGASAAGFTLTGSAPLSNVYGLTAVNTANGVELFATTANSSGTSSALYELTDPSGFDGTLTGTPTELTAAPADTDFRGLVDDDVAVAAAPEPASLALLALGLTPLLGRRRPARRRPA
jgi:hypothetical protein